MRVEFIALIIGALLLTSCGGVTISPQFNSIGDLREAITTPPAPQLSHVPAPAPAASSGTSSSGALQQMIEQHNSTRQSLGLQPLKHNSRLANAALEQAEYCARINRLTHTGERNSTVGTRTDAAGYQWNIVGENLAFSTRPSGIYNLWLSSQGHYDNIANARYTELGVARVAANGGEYWCVVFGGPR